MTGYRDVLVRGALVNLLGLLAKLVHPLFLVVITLQFGAATVGLYLLALSIVQIGGSAVTAGYNDATTLFGSAHADPGADAGELYRVFANGLVAAVGLALVLMVGLIAAAGPITEAFFSDRPSVAGVIATLAWALPFQALGRISVAATKAAMTMSYDALAYGLVEPLALLAAATLAWLMGGGVSALALAYVVAQAAAAVVGLCGMARLFDTASLVRAIVRFRWRSDMFRFALPQNLNRTLGIYITRLDVIMLGALGASNTVLGLYGTAALFASNLRQIRLLFSSALAPIVARHHARGERAEIIEHLGTTSRWTTSLVVPAILLLAVIHPDLFRWIDPAYTGQSGFFLVLLVSPFLNCALGLVGNCIVFTHHTQANLFNSIVVAGLNTGLNLLLIPLYGVYGAAAATVTSVAIISVLQVVELWYLERLWVRAADVWQPWVGLVVLLIPVGLFYSALQSAPVIARFGAALALVVAFGLLIRVLGHPEMVGWLSGGRWRPRSGPHQHHSES